MIMGQELALYRRGGHKGRILIVGCGEPKVRQELVGVGIG